LAIGDWRLAIFQVGFCDKLGRAIRRDSCLNFSMNIQVAVLCDAATDDNGKLNLLGSFDTIFSPQLPAVHPQCAVALRVTFMSGDEGNRKLKLNFVNADGRSIMPPIEIPVAVALPEDAHFVTRNFIVNIQGLKFPEAGVYSVDVRLDDKSRASIPLWIKNMPARPAA
jgi:Family of unknown function (DUF6941)